MAVRALHFFASSTLMADALSVIGATPMQTSPISTTLNFRLANMICSLANIISRQNRAFKVTHWKAAGVSHGVAQCPKALIFNDALTRQIALAAAAQAFVSTAFFKANGELIRKSAPARGGGLARAALRRCGGRLP